MRWAVSSLLSERTEMDSPQWCECVAGCGVAWKTLVPSRWLRTAFYSGWQHGSVWYQKVPFSSKCPDAVEVFVVSIWSAENAPSQIHEPM